MRLVSTEIRRLELSLKNPAIIHGVRVLPRVWEKICSET